jgi:TldD protein
MLGAYWDMVYRVLSGSTRDVRIHWAADTRVFASSEGSLITQKLARAEQNIQVNGLIPGARKPASVIQVPGFVPTSGGFECLLGPDLQEGIKIATEEAVRLEKIPITQAELGRYQAVFDGVSLGAIVGATLAKALQMGRVLGHEANEAGTSFLSPIEDVLGAQIFSKHLNVTADRSPPHLGAAKWDDEGVETETFPAVQNGQVVDYFTTRSTAPRLAKWYAKRNQPAKSRGSAVAWSASTPPMGYASNLIVGTGTQGTTQQALLSDLSDGIFIRGTDYISSDQQLASGSITPWMMYEVKKGQITRRLVGGGIQFGTKNFLNSITALGDASTVQHFKQTGSIGETWAQTVLPVAAPAARLGQVDVIQMEGRL